MRILVENKITAILLVLRNNAGFNKPKQKEDLPGSLSFIISMKNFMNVGNPAAMIPDFSLEDIPESRHTMTAYQLGLPPRLQLGGCKMTELSAR